MSRSRIVIAVLGGLAFLLIMAAVLFPVFGRAREKARMAPPSPPGMMMEAAAPYDAAEPVRMASTISDVAELPAVERKLIRTADLTLTDLGDAEQTIRQVEGIARDMGGFVGNTRLDHGESGAQWGSVTVRVPEGRFEEALGKLRELGKVQSVSTSVQDVTAEYVDLDARIRNAKRTEQEILKLMDRGGKLEDILSVASKLGEVREQVERLEGQMRVMREQVDLSTITVYVYEKGEAAVPQAGAYDLNYHLRSAVRALAALLRGIFTTLLYVVLVGWVFWLPLLIIIWLALRRRRARPAAAGPE